MPTNTKSVSTSSVRYRVGAALRLRLTRWWLLGRAVEQGSRAGMPKGKESKKIEDLWGVRSKYDLVD